MLRIIASSVYEAEMVFRSTHPRSRYSDSNRDQMITNHPYWPLYYTGMSSFPLGSNRQPADYKSAALPVTPEKHDRSCGIRTRVNCV